MIHLLFLLIYCSFMNFSTQPEWKLNTSNSGKLKEFQELFGKYGYTISSTNTDLDEIDSDPVKVVVHKASQLDEYVIVDDTSLEVEGAEVGINVRWLLNNLTDYIGHQATWKVLLAYHTNDQVFVFEGIVHGTIVDPKGQDGFGFDAVFLPNGQTKTLAECKFDAINARALAVDALLQNKPCAIESLILAWDGPWQVD